MGCNLSAFSPLILGALPMIRMLLTAALPLNTGWTLEDSVIVRLPVMLTLVTAALVLFSAWFS